MFLLEQHKRAPWAKATNWQAFRGGGRPSQPGKEARAGGLLAFVLTMEKRDLCFGEMKGAPGREEVPGVLVGQAAWLPCLEPDAF